jgi:nitrite reductase/ring-hydroxylating ferredoxin subunit
MIARAGPAFGVRDAWWPVASGDEVSNEPRAYRLGDRELCLYRDATDTVRAVDDRCPHRRMPLSMGWVTSEGWLQCPYHGWCFDGSTGRCAAIPNLHADEKVSPSIRVSVFATAENLIRRLRTNGDDGGSPAPAAAGPVVGAVVGGAVGAEVAAEDGLTMYDAFVADGFVHVWSGVDTAAEVAEPATSGPAAAGVLRGEVEVRAPHDRVADALLWNVGRMLGLGFLLGGGDEVVAPMLHPEDGAVVVRRERLMVDLPRPSTFDPWVRRTTRSTTTTLVDTGLTRVVAENAEGDVAARIVVALTPVSSYRTIVRWRGELVSPAGRAVTLAARAATAGQRLTGRPARLIERAADDVDQVVDPAVDRLRELREGT